MLLQKLLPADGGIIYAETDLNNLFPEPLNMISAGFFVVMAVYWIMKLNGYSKNHKILSIGSYILLIGSVGGTIYHGFRLHPFFILMDWLPILILCTYITVYFWAKVLKNWLYALIVLSVFVTVEFVAYKMLSATNMNLANNVNYALIVISAICPLGLYLQQTRFIFGKWVFISIGFFCIALFFRIADSWNLVHTGTHFLWHTFGAVATQAIFLYLYKGKLKRIQAEAALQSYTS